VSLVHRWTDPTATPADLRPCVATFGNFDGVHRGHQAILAEVVREARARHLPAVAVTFEPHPVQVLHPERAPELIAPGALRDALLEEAGLDGVLILEFTKEFAQRTAEDFIVSTFVEGLGAAALVVGEDTRGFGVGYTGDVALLRALGDVHGFDVLVLRDVGDDERWSSSATRARLREGRVAEAARILGRSHRVTGTVVHGDHRGRDLGYPTANLAPDVLGLVPADGVYAGWLVRPALPPGDPDRRLPAAVSVGTNPTFDGHERRVEAYVLDRTDLDLYGEQVVVSVQDLVTAMAEDVAQTRRLLEMPAPR
jgi:riboflavin kinase/FMN adenylyltransferase